jgi:hypothetical protein
MSHFVKLERPSVWRRLARAGWASPSDPSIHGFVDIDMTAALKFIDDLRASSGERVTITHLVAKAIAMAIREYPLLNGVIRWDGFYLRKTIDVFVLAARDKDAIGKGGGLSGIKIPQTDHRSVTDIAKYVNAKVPEVVSHNDPRLEPTQKMLAWVPDWLLKPVLAGIDFLTYELDLDLRGLGVPYDDFGTAVITNVGMLGLSNGFAPIFPPSRCPLVISVGEVREEPMVIDGQVVARPRLVLGCTVDHRFIDGLGASRMAKRFRELLSDPAAHFGDELRKGKRRKGAKASKAAGRAAVNAELRETVQGRPSKAARAKAIAVKAAPAKAALAKGARARRANGSTPPEPRAPGA